jgi:tetratricopeptide (TPR) repeat protein
MFILDDPEETKVWENIRADIARTWWRILKGKQEPAIVAYDMTSAGRIENFHFIWSKQSKNVRKRAVAAFKHLGPYSGKKLACAVAQNWLGITAAQGERWMARLAYREPRELEKLGRYSQCEAAWLSLVQEAEQELGVDFPATAEVRRELAEFYLKRWRLDDYDRAIGEVTVAFEECFRQSRADYARDLRNVYIQRARVDKRRGRLAAAESHYRRCLDIGEELAGYSIGFTWRDPVEMAKFFERHGRIDDAEWAFRYAVNKVRLAGGEKDHPYYSGCDNLAELADFYIRHNRFPEAERSYERLLEIYTTFKPPIRFEASFDWFVGYKGLLDKQGRLADLAGLQATLRPIEEAAGRLATPETGFGYIDADGAWAIEPRFRYADDFSEGFAKVMLDADGARNKRWAYIDKSGQVAFDAEFAFAESFRGGMAQVRLFDEDTCRVMDKDGNFLPQQYVLARPFSEGLSVVQVRRGGGSGGSSVGNGGMSGDMNRFGYMDENCCQVIPAKFTNASPFQGGRAIVGIGGQYATVGCVIQLEGIEYGVIDSNGNYLIEPRYKELHVYSEDLYSYRDFMGGGGLIDARGRVVLHLVSVQEIWSLTEGMCPFEARSTSDMFCVGQYGFLDTEGRIAIPPTFRFAYGFKEGLALVGGPDGRYGYINKSGEFQIPTIFELAEEFSGGLAAAGVIAKGERRWGFINTRGDYVIEPRFARIKDLAEGLAAVQLPDSEGGKWGYIDREGNMVIDVQFERYAEPFKKGRARVTFSTNGSKTRYGIIDKQGNYILPPHYEMVREFVDGLSAVSQNPHFVSIVSRSDDDSSFTVS